MDERRLPATTLPPPPASLWPRRRTVAALIAEGLTNAEIGRRLAIPEWVVADHVEHALRELRLRSHARIAAWSIARGLVTVTPAVTSDGAEDGGAAAAFRRTHAGTRPATMASSRLARP